MRLLPLLTAAAFAADASKRQTFQRGLIFALWSGEETGLLGSAAFCERPPVPAGKIVAYVNFDMVGRLRNTSRASSAAQPAAARATR